MKEWKTEWAVIGRLKKAAREDPKDTDHANRGRKPGDLWRTVIVSDLQELLHHTEVRRRYIEALERQIQMMEGRQEPVAWMNPDDYRAFKESGTTESGRVMSVQPGNVDYEPLYDRREGAWKDAVIDALVVGHIYRAEHESNPLKALSDLLAWETSIALDPAVSPDAKALIEQGLNLRDRMVLCPTCGNKRCPKATDENLACTGSNEPGQPGSAY